MNDNNVKQKQQQPTKPHIKQQQLHQLCEAFPICLPALLSYFVFVSLLLLLLLHLSDVLISLLFFMLHSKSRRKEFLAWQGQALVELHIAVLLCLRRK